MLKKVNRTQKHTTVAILSLAILVGSALMPLLSLGQVHAAQITDRSLTLLPGTNASDINTDGIDDGGSMAGATVNHLFDFTLPSSSNVGSIVFEYCTTAAAVPDGIDCNTPTGMDASGATIGDQSGAVGFSIDSTSSNEVIISRTAASATGTVSYRLDDVVNPTDINETFFVRISTHASEDGTGSAVDTGTVAASTAEPIILSGDMPESLVFCTGETIGMTGGVPDCSTATSGDISFDSLFSPTDTSTATSQMAASTNAGDGYAITVNGPTLTSGGNQIDPMDDGAGGPDTITLGTSQFGFNLVANTVTDANDDPLGLDVDPASNQDNYRGIPSTNYGTQDAFKFGDGDVVANSDDGGAGGTDSQIFTSSYVVNVPGSQPAGTYTTTLTYIATGTF